MRTALPCPVLRLRLGRLRHSVLRVTIETTWRGEFSSDEADRLHVEAFGAAVVDVADRDWRRLVEQHSLGWVTAREAATHGAAAELAGFVNVVWDGRTHAWLQDVMVAADCRRQGLGVRLVQAAADGARAAGCEWLHVDFEADLRPFYLNACGFTSTNAGLMRL